MSDQALSYIHGGILGAYLIALMVSGFFIRYRLAKIVVREGLASSVFGGMSGTAWLRVTSEDGRLLRTLSFAWFLGGLVGWVVLGLILSVVFASLHSPGWRPPRPAPSQQDWSPAPTGPATGG
jgi:hypothetical protein